MLIFNAGLWSGKDTGASLHGPTICDEDSVSPESRFKPALPDSCDFQGDTSTLPRIYMSVNGETLDEEELDCAPSGHDGWDEVTQCTTLQASSDV
jgi:hypothetical protein